TPRNRTRTGRPIRVESLLEAMPIRTSTAPTRIKRSTPNMRVNLGHDRALREGRRARRFAVSPPPRSHPPAPLLAHAERAGLTQSRGVSFSRGAAEYAEVGCRAGLRSS